MNPAKAKKSSTKARSKSHAKKKGRTGRFTTAPPLNQETLGSLSLIPKSAIYLVCQMLDLQALRCRLQISCSALRFLTSQSAAVAMTANVRVLGKGATSGITKVLSALALMNSDQLCHTVVVGNHRWGKTSTKQLLKLFPALRKLDLDTSKKVDINGFNDMTVELAPHLSELTWRWAYGTTQSSLANFVRGRTCLQALELSRLEGMGDRHGASINDEFLELISRECPELVTLKLNGALSITDSGVAALTASACGQTLVNVILMRDTIFTAERPWMGETHDSLYGGVTQASAESLKALPHIETWAISGFPNFSGGSESRPLSSFW